MGSSMRETDISIESISKLFHVHEFIYLVYPSSDIRMRVHGIYIYIRESSKDESTFSHFSLTRPVLET